MKGKVKEEITKMIQLQRVTETVPIAGVPESQAAIEVINAFNLDMEKIQSNMNKMADLILMAHNRAKIQQAEFLETEQMTIRTVKRQADLDSNIETII
jgi:hypothetical protein